MGGGTSRPKNSDVSNPLINEQLLVGHDGGLGKGRSRIVRRSFVSLAGTKALSTLLAEQQQEASNQSALGKNVEEATMMMKTQSSSEDDRSQLRTAGSVQTLSEDSFDFKRPKSPSSTNGEDALFETIEEEGGKPIPIDEMDAESQESLDWEEEERMKAAKKAEEEAKALLRPQIRYVEDMQKEWIKNPYLEEPRYRNPNFKSPAWTYIDPYFGKKIYSVFFAVWFGVRMLRRFKEAREHLFELMQMEDTAIPVTAAADDNDDGDAVAAATTHQSENRWNESIKLRETKYKKVCIVRLGHDTRQEYADIKKMVLPLLQGIGGQEIEFVDIALEGSDSKRQVFEVDAATNENADRNSPTTAENNKRPITSESGSQSPHRHGEFSVDGEETATLEYDNSSSSPRSWHEPSRQISEKLTLKSRPWSGSDVTKERLDALDLETAQMKMEEMKLSRQPGSILKTYVEKFFAQSGDSNLNELPKKKEKDNADDETEQQEEDEGEDEANDNVRALIGAKKTSQMTVDQLSQAIEASYPLIVVVIGSSYGRPWRQFFHENIKNEELKWVRDLEAWRSGLDLAVRLILAVMQKRATAATTTTAHSKHAGKEGPFFFARLITKSRYLISPEQLRRVENLIARINKATVESQRFMASEGDTWIESFRGQVSEKLRLALKMQKRTERRDGSLRFKAEYSDIDYFTRTSHPYLIMREKQMAELFDYVNSEVAWPLVVTGSAGSGKSTLLCHFYREFRAKNPGGFVIYHNAAIGTDSSDLMLTWFKIVNTVATRLDISRALGALRYDTVVHLWKHMLYNKMLHEQEQIVIILDGMDKLTLNGIPHLTTEYLARGMPPNVRLILCTGNPAQLQHIKDTFYFKKRTAFETSLLELFVLELEAIPVDKVMEYSKQRIQLDEGEFSEHDSRWVRGSLRILENDEDRCNDGISPLHLHLLICPFRETVFQTLNQAGLVTAFFASSSLPSTVPELIRFYFRVIRLNMGYPFTRAFFGHLVCARDGLLLSDLRELVGRFTNRNISFMTWETAMANSSLFCDIVAHAAEPDSQRICLKKGILRDNCKAIFVSDAKFAKKIHDNISALYLEQLAFILPENGIPWSGRHFQALNDVVYHLTNGSNPRKLLDVLCNLRYVEARCSFGLSSVFSLLADYGTVTAERSAANKHIFHNEIVMLQDFMFFLIRYTNMIAREPRMVFPMAVNLPDMSAPSIRAKDLWTRKAEKLPLMLWLNKPQNDPCKRIFMAHKMAVNCCAFSPSGNIFATASEDCTVKIWKINSIDSIACFHGHKGSITSCVFPTPSTLLTASHDGTLRLWQVPNTNQIQLETESIAVIKAHSDVVWTCSSTADGKLWASGGGDCLIKFWKNEPRVAESGAAINCSGKYVRSVRFGSKDESLLAVCCGDSVAMVCSAATRTILMEIQGEDSSSFLSAQLLGEVGRQVLMLTSSSDGYLRIWNMEQKEIVRKSKGPHKGFLWCARASPNGAVLASCGADYRVCFWDPKGTSEKELFNIEGHTAAVYSCDFSPDSKWLITASGDGTARLWATNLDPTHYSLKGYWERFAEKVLMGNDEQNSKNAQQQRAVTPLPKQGEDNLDKSWDVSAMREAWRHSSIGESPINCIAISHDSRTVFAGSADGFLQIIDVAKQRIQHCIPAFGVAIKTMAISPDGNNLATGTADGQVCIWDIVKRKIVLHLVEHREPVWCCEYHPTLPIMVSGAADNMAIAWNLEEGKSEDLEHPFGHKGESAKLHLKVIDPSKTKVIKRLRQHNNAVMVCRFAKSGKLLATGCADNHVRLFDVENDFAMLQCLQSHTGYIRCMFFTPDSKSLVTGSGDRTVRVWDVELGTVTNQLSGHRTDVWSCAKAPDQGSIVAAASGNSIWLWDWEATKDLCQLRTNQPILCLDFSGNGRFLITGLFDGTVRAFVKDKAPASMKKDNAGVRRMTWFRLKMLIRRMLAQPLMPAIGLSHNGLVVATAKQIEKKRFYVRVSNAFGDREKFHMDVYAKIIVIAVGNNAMDLATAERGSIQFWNETTLTGTIPQAHDSDVTCMQFLPPTENRLCSFGADSEGHIWDVKSCTKLFSIKGHVAPVRCCNVSLDGKFIITGSDDKTSKFINTVDGKALGTCAGHLKTVTTCALSKEKTLMVSGGDDNCIRVFKIPAKMTRMDPPMEISTIAADLSGGIVAVTFTPDNERIIAVSGAGVVKIWKTQSKRVVRVFHFSPFDTTCKSPLWKTGTIRCTPAATVIAVATEALETYTFCLQGD